MKIDFQCEECGAELDTEIDYNIVNCLGCDVYYCGKCSDKHVRSYIADGFDFENGSWMMALI